MWARGSGGRRGWREPTVPWATARAHRQSRPPSRRPVRSEDAQVALELPGGDLDPVVLPLLALDLDEAVERVLAQCAQHELRLGGDLDRLSQRLRELLDP